MISSVDDFFKLYESALEDYRNGRPEQALLKQQELRRHSAGWPKLYLLEAYIYRDMNRFVTETRILRKVLGLLEKDELPQPELEAEVWSMLGSALLTLGQPREAVGALLRSAELETEAEKKRVECSNAIFAANSAADFSAEEFQALYSYYRELCSDAEPYPRQRYQHKRIRIGYLSSDLRKHPVAYFLWPLLHGHHREEFSVYCYAANDSEDEVTRQMQRESEHWRNVANLSPQEIAAAIHEDEIDILLELNGHTKNNCLPVLAWQPATVQLSGIGYMNSTGLNTTDYFLSDAVCAGDEEASRLFFTEKMLPLRHSHFCYAPLYPFPDCGEAPCMRNGYVTFGCFNNFSKVTDGMLRLWGSILASVPDSRLIFKHRIFNEEEGREFTVGRLRSLGICTDRIELRGFSSDYLEEYNEIDIAFDTFPYTGGLTTCEALYMGVPVISLYGRRHGTRFGLSLLTNAGVGELAVPSEEQYASLAVALAKDRNLVDDMHRDLRLRMEHSRLMNEALYVRETEDVYRRILAVKETEKHC